METTISIERNDKFLKKMYVSCLGWRSPLPAAENETNSDLIAASFIASYLLILRRPQLHYAWE
jgi:hypothetical protein